jgi:DNA-directed RNA polymerase subunit beta'
MIFNDMLHPEMPFYNDTLGQEQLRGVIVDCARLLGRDETVRLLDALKDLGLRTATRSGVSLVADDLKIAPSKGTILAEAEKNVAGAAELCRRGITIDMERYSHTLDAWTHAREQVTSRMMDALRGDLRDGKVPLNPLSLIVEPANSSGVEALRKLAGMPGLIADPSGRILEVPIKVNLREDLSMIEYDESTLLARTGSEAEARDRFEGARLAVRLIEAARDVIVTEEDCGMTRGIDKGVVADADRVRPDPGRFNLAPAILGRVALTPSSIRSPGRSSCVKAT